MAMYTFNGLTSRGTVDGRPLLFKHAHDIAYRCCEVTACAILTTRCWVCGLHTGVAWDSLSYREPLRRTRSGAQMGFSPPGPLSVLMGDISYEDGYWYLRSPA